MLAAYVSDEYYAALAGVKLEFRGPAGSWEVTESTPSGAVHVSLPPGEYEVCLVRQGYGSKRVRAKLDAAKPVQIRLLSERLLGYACPKWCRGGERVEFRVHSVEPYKLG